MSTFQVVRTYSHTDKRCLWSVESRRFDFEESTRAHTKGLADTYCAFAQAEWDREHPRQSARFFVVEVLL